MTPALAMTPVTTRTDGFDPPSTSCMKKVNGWWASGFGRMALVAVTPLAVVGAAPMGPATDELGASATGVVTGFGDSGGPVWAGSGPSSSRTLAELAHVKAMTSNNR